MNLILKENKINEACQSRLVSAYLPLIEEENAEIITMSWSRQLFYTNFREQFTYESNAIEGNKVTLPETFEILRNHVTIDGKPLKDQMEIIGHAKAFDYLVDTATNENISLSNELILNIHKMIFEDGNPIAGRYRGFGEDVGVGNPATGEMFHRGINPLGIHDSLDGLIETYNELSQDKTVNLLALLAGFHLCFENIHPFLDGNGRTGRLLVNFELIKHNYLPIDIKFAERSLYYAAFETPDDYSGMTSLFARAMMSSLAMYKQLYKQYMNGGADKLPIYQADTFLINPPAQSE